MKKEWWFEMTEGDWPRWKLWGWLSIRLVLVTGFLLVVWFVIPGLVYLLGYLVAFLSIAYLLYIAIRRLIQELKWDKKKSKQTGQYISTRRLRK